MNPVWKAVNDLHPVKPLILGFDIEVPSDFVEEAENGSLKCKTCKRYCIIPPGELGYCYARENRNGKLFNRVFGSLANLGPGHYYGEDNTLDIGSFYCNFRCRFCFAYTWLKDKKKLPEGEPFKYPFGSLSERYDDKEKKLTVRRIVGTPEMVVELCKQINAKKIVIGRSEPTVNFEYYITLAVLAKQKGIDVHLYTNGYSTELVTRAFASTVKRVIVGVKCYFDQEGYNKVVTPDCNKIDVNEILNTIVDYVKYGCAVTVNVIADGLHGSPSRGLEMFKKLKIQLENLGNGLVEWLNISIAPVVCFSDRVVINPFTKENVCDYLNVRPGDIIGAMEFEMALKELGFKNAHTSYSINYKRIYGDYPSFYPGSARTGLLAEVEKIKDAGNDIKSYVHFECQNP